MKIWFPMGLPPKDDFFGLYKSPRVIPVNQTTTSKARGEKRTQRGRGTQARRIKEKENIPPPQQPRTRKFTTKRSMPPDRTIPKACRSTLKMPNAVDMAKLKQRCVMVFWWSSLPRRHEVEETKKILKLK